MGNTSGTEVYTTANLDLPYKDILDLERYIDVKRGELYLAKGIIFVEGIAEEYLVPSFAKKLGYDLDRLGVAVCNIDSTNFWPYKQFTGLTRYTKCNYNGREIIIILSAKTRCLEIYVTKAM